MKNEIQTPWENSDPLGAIVPHAAVAQEQRNIMSLLFQIALKHQLEDSENKNFRLLITSRHFS